MATTYTLKRKLFAGTAFEIQEAQKLVQDANGKAIRGMGTQKKALAKSVKGYDAAKAEMYKQFEAYKNVLESMKGKKVIIRTLDIGADKKVDYFNLDDEENPAMGIRAIRICLTRPEIFKTQLRALFRASVYGDLGIMFPMITSELDTHGIPYADNIELGIMIETPAAAVISDKLAPMVDFFSVGTNDLTQYTLACDRQNPKIERFVDTHHEAVLRLIEMAAKAAHDNGKWIGICGELGADTSLTERFLRMGIDELSVSPPSVLKVRDKVRSIDLSK